MISHSTEELQKHIWVKSERLKHAMSYSMDTKNSKNMFSINCMFKENIKSKVCT